MATLHPEPATHGDLDLLISEASRRLEENYGEDLRIDFSSVTTIRSCMIDRLIRLHLDARRLGANLILENVTDLVLEVLLLTRLDRMLDIRRDQAHENPSQSHLASLAQ